MGDLGCDSSKPVTTASSLSFLTFGLFPCTGFAFFAAPGAALVPLYDVAC